VITELTIKQAEFALKYVELGNAAEAYRQSYDVGEDTKPETVWADASRVLARPLVAARVFGLQEAARKAHEVTLESITKELDENRELALNEKQSAAATAATMGKAKMHGLLVEKKEISGGFSVTLESDASKL
jgi:phage terminase small subunit